MPYINRKKLQEGFLLCAGEHDTLRQEAEKIIDKHALVITKPQQQQADKPASNQSTSSDHKQEMERIFS